MNFESDFTIASTVGHEEEFVAAIGPSIEECASLNVISRGDAINFLIPRVR